MGAYVYTYVQPPEGVNLYREPAESEPQNFGLVNISRSVIDGTAIPAYYLRYKYPEIGIKITDQPLTAELINNVGLKSLEFLISLQTQQYLIKVSRIATSFQRELDLIGSIATGFQHFSRIKNKGLETLAELGTVLEKMRTASLETQSSRTNLISGLGALGAISIKGRDFHDESYWPIAVMASELQAA